MLIVIEYVISVLLIMGPTPSLEKFETESGLIATSAVLLVAIVKTNTS